ncbi:uncharacterized protein VTP21DRAFT_7277 [Calcarisporiella thermophila]|uniref:uncharacterized protein n=1 Tax=Calcarisporiella thermophila TaxID=911321 RepID=UPI00374416F0
MYINKRVPHSLPSPPQIFAPEQNISSPLHSSPNANRQTLSQLHPHHYDTTSLNSPADHMDFLSLEVLDNFYIDEYEDEYIDAELNHRKREAAAQEIFQSERTYVHGLRKLRDLFYLPMTAHVKTGKLMSQDEFQTIFSNFEEILELHEQLLNDLCHRRLIWGPAQLISDIFLRYESSFQIYGYYLQKFPLAVRVLERLQKSNSNFRRFLEQCYRHPRHELLNLQAYLLLPVQRLPRYKLLLEALLKRTPPLHPDYANLQYAYQRLTSIAEEINEMVRDSENRRRVSQIQPLLYNLPIQLASPYRRFVAQSDMYNVNPMIATNLESRSYILFNDLLLVCKRKDKGYVVKQFVDMHGVSARAAQERVVGHSLCFEIRKSKGVLLVVKARTEEERHRWINHLNEAASVLDIPSRRLSEASTAVTCAPELADLQKREGRGSIESWFTGSTKVSSISKPMTTLPLHMTKRR